ncbi:MAG TPA: sialidase family protein [Candidatus Dormibacteraeota bacterium]
MRRLGLALAAALLSAMAVSTPASAAGWSSNVFFTNQVASVPVQGGGYPVPAGATAPVPGTCRLGLYNSNRSESWIAVQPGTENLLGVSKFFFEKYSTFYDFHLGSYTMPNGTPGQNTQIPGYDCISTGTQDMPPSWTNNTDPNVDFDTRGRAYQATLPFNAYWVNLRPNGAIGIVYSDDLGRSWHVGNGGKFLSLLPNSTALSLGDVVDKQWIAVNHIPGNRYQDHVYAMWAVFNGVNAVEIFFAKSVDRGLTFTPTRRITPPQTVGPAATYVYPSIDAAGNLFVSVAAFKAKGSTDAELWVARSTDDGNTFTWFDTGQKAHGTPGPDLPNTTFRDGILQNFAASPTYPNHMYLAYEDWDGTQMDVKFMQSVDGGATWSAPFVVNDASNSSTTDQFQPSVAAGPGGAVAVAFYDRRMSCPADPSVRPQDVGLSNFCIDVSVQALKDTGSGAVVVGPNARASEFTWDPMQPDQHVDGLGQMACASHRDPCLVRAFIGDYFGLAISATNIYTFSVSTHYPSGVNADEGGKVYYQQQILGKVPRAGFGSGF